MAMDTEESLKEYLRLQLKIPLLARIGPLARTLRLRGQRRAGRQGDPHRRQARLGGAGATTTTSSSSTPSATRPHRRPARRAAGDQRAGAGRAWSATRPAGCSTSSPTRPRPASSIVSAPEEMPVTETHRAGRPDRRTETDVDLAAVVVNRVLPELFGRGEEEMFDALRDAGAARGALADRVGAGVEPRARRRRARRHPAPHPGRHLDTPARRAAAGPAAALRARTCSPAPTACAPRAGRRALGEELGY